MNGDTGPQSTLPPSSLGGSETFPLPSAAAAVDSSTSDGVKHPPFNPSAGPKIVPPPSRDWHALIGSLLGYLLAGIISGVLSWVLQKEYYKSGTDLQKISTEIATEGRTTRLALDKANVQQAEAMTKQAEAKLQEDKAPAIDASIAINDLAEQRDGSGNIVKWIEVYVSISNNSVREVSVEAALLNVYVAESNANHIPIKKGFIENPPGKEGVLSWSKVLTYSEERPEFESQLHQYPDATSFVDDIRSFRGSNSFSFLTGGVDRNAPRSYDIDLVIPVHGMEICHADLKVFYKFPNAAGEMQHTARNADREKMFTAIPAEKPGN